jgi:hypothetical protein
MAQILWSIYQKEAVVAYNDPKQIFTDPGKYRKIYPKNGNDIDLDYYLFASQLFIKIWSLKRQDVASMERGSKEREIFSSSLSILLLLNAISSLFLKSTSKMELSHSNNLFRDRKKQIFEALDSEDSIKEIYSVAKQIIIEAVFKYEEERPNTKYIKYRKFDSEYLLPIVEKVIKSNKVKM